jgi:hypothetical protein
LFGVVIVHVNKMRVDNSLWYLNDLLLRLQSSAALSERLSFNLVSLHKTLSLLEVLLYSVLSAPLCSGVSTRVLLSWLVESNEVLYFS